MYVFEFRQTQASVGALLRFSLVTKTKMQPVVP